MFFQTRAKVVKFRFKLNIVIKVMADEMMVKELEEVVVRFSGADVDLETGNTNQIL